MHVHAGKHIYKKGVHYMKKLLLSLILLVSFFCFAGYSPTAPPSKQGPVIIDDFTDGINVNDLGGIWFYYGDTEAGVSESYTTDTDYTSEEGNSLNLAHSTTETWGWGAWLVTTFAKGSPAVDISSYTGVRFQAMDVNQGNYDLVILADVTRINYKHTFQAPATWGQVDIPFTDLAQDRPDGVSRDKVLKNAKRLCWAVMDKATKHGNLLIDHVEFY
jgi:hypothetical protein